MTKLQLSFAMGNYDRTRALIDSAVTIDGVDPVYMTLLPEEIFFRAFRAAEFDICELSLSSYTIQTARGESHCSSRAADEIIYPKEEYLGLTYTGDLILIQITWVAC